MTSSEQDRHRPSPDHEDLQASGDLQTRIDAGGERFRTLPPPPDPEQLSTTQDVSPGPDPEGDRNAENDWFLRYGNG
jgi:hypothetical protein